MTPRDRLKRALAVSPLAVVQATKRVVRRRGGIPDRRLVDHYLTTEPRPRLHLGCGSRMLEGWLNTDLQPRLHQSVFLDAQRPLPFPDATFHRVYSEHMIEHLDLGDGGRLLAELARVLCPGGRIRIATPDLDRLLGLFVAPERWTDDQRRYVELIVERHVPGVDPTGASPVFVLNNNVREWGHRFLYDEELLRTALTDAGFVDITRHELQESDEPDFVGLANESRMPPGLVAFETMTLEAVRP